MMKNRGFRFARILVIICLLISVVFPLLKLFLSVNTKDILRVFTDPQFLIMIKNSLFTSSVSTIIAVLLAWILAWCVNRSNIRFKTILTVLFTLPMLIPSISHGMGLVLLFGDNGIITNALEININLYGYTGIILGSLLYSFPVAFLMLTDIFRYEDFTVYEAADVLGLSKFHQFKTITLPNMRKPLISVIFAVFTMVFTDYGVPLVVGGKMMTLPIYMYREVIGLLDFSKGALIGIILLVPAVIAFLFDLLMGEGNQNSTVTKSFVVSKNKLRDGFCYIFCALIIFLISLPLMAFVFLSFVKQYPINLSFSLVHLKEFFDLSIGNYLLNSLSISLITSLVGMGVIFFTAYLTTRMKKTFSTMTLHLVSMISLAIPGIVLGLSYVLFFKGSWIYGTLIILVLVNMVHFFASPYLLAYNSLSMFDEKLEDVSEVMGISRMKMLLDVYVPSTRETIIEIFSYIFVNCMVTISAVSFLANFKNLPLALMIPQFDSLSMIEITALISLFIFGVNIILKLAVYETKRYIRRNNL